MQSMLHGQSQAGSARVWTWCLLLIVSALFVLTPSASSAAPSNGWSGVVTITNQWILQPDTTGTIRDSSITRLNGDGDQVFDGSFSWDTRTPTGDESCPFSTITGGVSVSGDPFGAGVQVNLGGLQPGEPGNYVLYGAEAIRDVQMVETCPDQTFVDSIAIGGYNVTNVDGVAPAGWTTLSGHYSTTTNLATTVYSWSLTTYPDRDHDGIPDTSDNCPDVSNVSQDNHDDDSLGDECDADDDNDGLTDDYETNTSHTQPLVYDSDGDTYGDGDEVNASPPSDPNDPGSVPGGGGNSCEGADQKYTATSGEARVNIIGPDPHLFQYFVNAAWCVAGNQALVKTADESFEDIADPLLVTALKTLANVELHIDPLVPPSHQLMADGSSLVHSSAVFSGCYSPLDVVLLVVGEQLGEAVASAVARYASRLRRDPVAALAALKTKLGTLVESVSQKFEDKLTAILKTFSISAKKARAIADRIDDGLEDLMSEFADDIVDNIAQLVGLSKDDIKQWVKDRLGVLGEACGPIWTPDFAITLFPDGRATLADEGSAARSIVVDYSIETNQ